MKFETHLEYDHRHTALAESAFLSVWSGLNAWHENLVLVGGLVPKYLCSTPSTPGTSLPRPVTLDVDLGITLASDEGRYGSLRSELSGHGFRASSKTPTRFEKTVNGHTIPLDFLTELPPRTQGAVPVEDIAADIMPGINRALATPRSVTITGHDLLGARQTVTARVCEVGPFLALKLRAFGRRQQSKDAFDLLYTLKHYDQGTPAAIRAFADEVRLGNTAIPDALSALGKLFAHEDSPGPTKAAHFVFGDRSQDTPDLKIQRRLLAQEMHGAALSLLAGTERPA